MKKQVATIYIKSENQQGDLDTKTLGKAHFFMLCNKVGMLYICYSLRESVDIN